MENKTNIKPNNLQQELPRGTKIKLLKIEDPYSTLTPGQYGTVQSVDSNGQIKVLWADGSTLSLLYGIDSFVIDN